ncbi:MAG: ribosome silencing factor [Atopobiaceae bacterium]|nr:ribosome silencing factor [Atopobiaceae bacterium]
MSSSSLEIARIAALAADEKKAHDIVLIDLAESSDVCDYFLVCSATNRRLCDAVVEAIEESLRINCSARPFSIEGREEASWVLMDYGTVVVHVFLPETREYYRLERLWGDAPRIELGLEGELDMTGQSYEPEELSDEASHVFEDLNYDEDDL